MESGFIDDIDHLFGLLSDYAKLLRMSFFFSYKNDSSHFLHHKSTRVPTSNSGKKLNIKMDISVVLMLVVRAILMIASCTLIVKFLHGKSKYFFNGKRSVPGIVDNVFLNFFYTNIKLLPKSRKTKVKIFDQWCMKCDKYFKFWYGPKSAVVITGHEEVKKVFVSPLCIEKYNFVYQYIDEKYSLAAGSVMHGWSESRKVASLAFTPKCLENMTPKFERTAKSFSDKMMALKPEDVFNMKEETEPCLFEMFSDIFLNVTDYEDFDKIRNAYLM